MTIRQARAPDLADIQTCARLAYRRYIPIMGREPAPVQADYAARIAQGRVYVIDNNQGNLAGFICFYPDPPAMILETVAVLPRAQGQGLGKKLIRFCETKAARLHLASVKLYTNEKMTGNRQLYPALGYHETDHRTEHGFARIYFEKPIPGDRP